MTDDGCYCCCGRIVGHTGNCYGVESPIRNARASDARGDNVAQVIAELKAKAVEIRPHGMPLQAVRIVSRIQALIDQLPDPPKPDVVVECEKAFWDGYTIEPRTAMLAALRKARELWGLPPLKELEER